MAFILFLHCKYAWYSVHCCVQDATPASPQLRMRFIIAGAIPHRTTDQQCRSADELTFGCSYSLLPNIFRICSTDRLHIIECLHIIRNNIFNFHGWMSIVLYLSLCLNA